MQLELFRDDIEAKPAALRQLADRIDAADGLRWPLLDPAGHLLLTGMGSSYFAAGVAALRLRRRGIVAVAERASVEASWPPSPEVTHVAISASGASKETLERGAAVSTGGGRVIGLTNTIPSPLCELGSFVDMAAGLERSGVACRSYLHTLLALLALEEQLTGVSLALSATCRRTATAIEHLIESSDKWLPAVADLAIGPQGTWLLAPAERLGSALQGALMLREVPRRAADGCETGDWCHVDVYLTKTLDYRAIVYPGSRFDGDATRWLSERSATFVSVGSRLPGARYTLAYPGFDEPLVALITEPVLAELLSAWVWSQN